MGTPRWLAAHVERGTLRTFPLAWFLSHLYGVIARPFLVRPVDIPPGVRIIGVGSAVLGGAGKTIVAIAYARAFRKAGARVALVSHGYGGRARGPVLCGGDEDARHVGDDALVAAQELRGLGVEVWVGSDRGLAIREAARRADIVVVDGLLQAKPRALARSVIVLDANHPFGSGACPPSGDLRGPVQALLRLCDEAVLVRDELAGACPFELERLLAEVPVVRTAWLGVAGLVGVNGGCSLDRVASMAVGYASLLARPERVLETLRLRKIVPVCRWHGPDHGMLSGRDVGHLRGLACKHRLGGWLIAAKCATHFTNLDIGAPVMAIDITSRLDPEPLPVQDSPS